MRPDDEVAGINERPVVRVLEVPRVPHHRTGPAAVRSGVCVELLIRNDLEELVHHLSEVGWLPLSL